MLTKQGSDQCDKCKVAKDGPYCKDKCPSRKYLDSSGICRDCHEYCDDQGCKGPRPDQSLEGCIACQLPLVANISSKQAMCLPPKSKCPSEYFFRPTRAVSFEMLKYLYRQCGLHIAQLIDLWLV